MSLQDETGLFKFKGKVETGLLAKEKASEYQWTMVEQAINAFIQKYPHIWVAFNNDQRKEKSGHDAINKYGHILKEDGKKTRADRRKTATFPSAQWYNQDNELETDSLLWVIECIIPGLTHKNSVNYQEFLRRFPIFSPTWVSNTESKLG